MIDQGMHDVFAAFGADYYRSREMCKIAERAKDAVEYFCRTGVFAKHAGREGKDDTSSVSIIPAGVLGGLIGNKASNGIGRHVDKKYLKAIEEADAKQLEAMWPVWFGKKKQGHGYYSIERPYNKQEIQQFIIDNGLQDINNKPKLLELEKNMKLKAIDRKLNPLLVGGGALAGSLAAIAYNRKAKKKSEED